MTSVQSSPLPEDIPEEVEVINDDEEEGEQEQEHNRHSSDDRHLK